jgi:hypothetical protein
MKKNLSSLILTLSCFLTEAVACDCTCCLTFCESITQLDNQDVRIHLVRVLEKSSAGIDIDVLQTFIGESLEGQETFVINGNGADCTMTTNQFLVGEKYILLLSPLSDDVWYLSECSMPFLAVENDMVIGSIAEGLNQVALENFPATIQNCFSTSPSTEPQANISFSVNPTAAYDFVTIKTQGLAPTNFILHVLDSSGKLIHQAILPTGSISTEVQISRWRAGIYFFKIEDVGSMSLFKVVKLGG